MNRISMGLVLACGLSGLVSAEAQERRLFRDRPAAGERLDRLKDLGGRLLDSFTKPEGPQQPLDIGKLNSAFDSVLQTIVQRETVVESLHLALDPRETSLADDRVLLIAAALFSRTAWANGPSQFDLSLHARVEPAGSPIVPGAGLPSDPGAGRLNAVFEGRAVVSTDVLGLVNYALPRLDARLREGQIRDSQAHASVGPVEPPRVPIAAARLDPESAGRLPPPPGEVAREPRLPAPLPVNPSLTLRAGMNPPVPSNAVGDPFQTLLSEKLSRTGEVRSFDEFADLLTHISSLQFVTISESIERLTVAHSLSRDEVERQRLFEQLSQARRSRDELMGGRAVIWRDEQGRAERITLNAVNTRLPGGAQIDRLDVVITPTGVTATATSRITQGVEIYALVKPLLMSTLSKIQNRDQPTLDSQRGFIQRFLDWGRPYLLGEP